MDAIRQLLHDHEEVEKFYHQYIMAGEAFDKKMDIARQVIEEINHHVQKEEKVLFPAFVQMGGEEAEEMVQHALEEHRLTEFVMGRIQKAKSKDDAFDAKFKTLMEATKHHYEYEETDLFPKAKETLQGELKQLGEEMDNIKGK